MWRYVPFFTLILLCACTTMTPSRPVSVAGRPPAIVLIELASKIEKKPYSSEELADPVIQEIIAQCERQGLGMGCREKKQISKRLRQFVRTQDEKIFVKVELKGLEADRDYTVEFLFFDPDDNFTGRWTLTLKTHPKLPPKRLKYWCTYSPSSPTTLPLGQWRIQVSVNGEVEGVRTFEVVD